MRTSMDRNMNGLLADLKCKTGRMSRYKSNPLEPTSRASIRHLVIVFEWVSFGCCLKLGTRSIDRSSGCVES